MLTAKAGERDLMMRWTCPMDLQGRRYFESMHYNDEGLPPLNPRDALGRGIFSRTRAKRAAGRGVDHHAFLEAEGVTTFTS